MSTLLIPGLLCTPRLFFSQLPALWQLGPVTVADHRAHDDLGRLARGILDHAPPTFDLVGLSMGGYVAFEIMRQQPQRVRKLVLLNTTARPDGPERMRRPGSRLGLATISCLTLVLVGEQDITTPSDRAEETAAGIPHVRLHVVPDCGHLATLEQPGEVTAALVAWLRS